MHKVSIEMSTSACHWVRMHSGMENNYIKTARGVHNVFRPAVWLMERLNFRQKFLLLGLVFTCASGVLLLALHSQFSAAKLRLDGEHQGNELIAQISHTVRLVQQHRGLSAAVVGGNKAMADALSKKDTETDASFRHLMGVLGTVRSMSGDTAEIEAAWDRILAQGRGLAVADNFAWHSRLIERLLKLEIHVADSSGMILDSEINTHYLVDITVSHLPAVLERLGQIRAYGTGILADHHISQERRFELLYLIADFQSTLRMAQAQLLRVRQHSPAYDQKLKRSGEAIAEAASNFSQIATDQTLNSLFTMTPEVYFSSVTRSIDAIYGELFDTFHASLDQLLHERQVRLQREIVDTLVLTCGLLLLLLYLVVGVYRSVTGNILRLQASMHQFAAGNFEQRVELNTRDELQHIGTQFNAMAAEIALLISTRQQALTRLVQINEQLVMAARVFHESHEGIALTDAQGTIQRVNPAFCAITGYAEDELLGQDHRILKSGKQGAEFYADMWNALGQSGIWQGEIWNRHKGGNLYAAMLTISALRDDKGNINQYVGLCSDITEIKVYKDQLERQAHYDELTGLPNRSLLADRLAQTIAGARRNAETMAVVALDLDGFKAINDTHGHEAGDRVLVDIGKRILGALRGTDTVARVGGDEFVMVLADVASDADCLHTLQRVLEHVSKPVSVGLGKFGSVTGSIGYTLFPDDDVQTDGLLRHADMAMYSSKDAGKNRITRFDVNLDHRQRGYAAAINRLEKGLQSNEFQLYVQPKIDLRTGSTVGAEALLRWMHPIRGLISPAEFLPLMADKKALSLAFDDWVLQEGVRILAQWQSQGMHIPLSLNMSPYQLQSDDFAEKMVRALGTMPGLSTSHLEIEILESSALDDLPRAVALIAECQALGIRFALDDFGTGYSTLTYLKQLSANTLKVDRSFVSDLDQVNGSRAIVKGIVAMAEAFECEVVAEGVETWFQAKELLDMGCFTIQGYVAAKPMPATDLPGWISTFTLPDLHKLTP